LRDDGAAAGRDGRRERKSFDIGATYRRGFDDARREATRRGGDVTRDVISSLFVRVRSRSSALVRVSAAHL
jgi:hypothetical protein